MLPPNIDFICDKMLEYQKQNKVINQCLTNTQYLFDYIKKNYPELKPKAHPVICLAHHENEDDTTYCIIHSLILLKDGTILDPSFESYDKNPYYLHSVKDFFDKIKNVDLSNEYKKQLLIHFVNISKCTNKINQNEHIICDKDFYHKQHDYIKYCISQKT